MEKCSVDIESLNWIFNGILWMVLRFVYNENLILAFFYRILYSAFSNKREKIVFHL